MYYNVYPKKIPCIFYIPLSLFTPRKETPFIVPNHPSYLFSSPISQSIRAFLPFQGKNSPPMPIHSGGETPGTDRLIPGAGFLLARRRMRWETGGTCLSAASCAVCFLPLAFFRKPRGTLPASPAHPVELSPARQHIFSTQFSFPPSCISPSFSIY